MCWIGCYLLFDFGSLMCGFLDSRSAAFSAVPCFRIHLASSVLMILILSFLSWRMSAIWLILCVKVHINQQYLSDPLLV
jgi:hypothetical protein